MINDYFGQDISALFSQTRDFLREMIKRFPRFDVHLPFDRSTNPLFVVIARVFVWQYSPLWTQQAVLIAWIKRRF